MNPPFDKLGVSGDVFCPLVLGVSKHEQRPVGALLAAPHLDERR